VGERENLLVEVTVNSKEENYKEFCPKNSASALTFSVSNFSAPAFYSYKSSAPEKFLSLANAPYSAEGACRAAVCRSESGHEPRTVQAVEQFIN
jgi:hypothetical protein